jgi:WD40 repeat protein/serine/threonine protein kinase/class 3 adenylate cyclase
VLLFSDIEGSLALKQKAGALAYGQALARHDALFKEIISSTAGAAIVKDTGDGFLASFPAVGDAINAALRFQYELSRGEGAAHRVRARIGIHLGQLSELEKEADGQPKLVGLAADVAARVMGLASGSQILLTRAAFDDGRQFVREHPPVNRQGEQLQIKWIAHGQYRLEGIDEPVEIFEIGAEGIAPLSVPCDGPKARRCVAVDDEPTLGWRPAAGGTIPGRSGWILQRKLGEGGFGEVWLGAHRQLREQRVFKFSFDVARVRSLKREMVLFRLLRNALGDRPDIARLYEVKLDEPPFFLESEYTEGGNLAEWAQRQGGIGQVPFGTRLELMAAIAEAVTAAHSVGILHKDIKPSNVLIDVRDGSPRPRLADFGIGMLADPKSLAEVKITVTGFTEITAEESSRAGTRLYAPPELLEGRPFTVQGDIYSLGVLLYQLVVGNLERSLAQGWQRNVPDELLREDIEACVDGEPNRRLASALELAARLRLLPQRWAMLAEQERARAQMEESKQREVEARRGEELAVLAEARTRSLLAQVHVRDGLAWLEQGDLSLALLFFVQGLRTDVDDPAAQRNQRIRIRSVMQAIAPVVRQPPAAALADPTITSTDKFWFYLGGGTRIAIHRKDSEEPPSHFLSHAAWINHATFSPDGLRIATASADRSARVWDAATVQALTPPLYHLGAVQYVAFTRDGARIVTASADKTARIWDSFSGAPLCEPMAHTNIVFDAIFNHDATRVATVSIGDSVRIWDAREAVPPTTDYADDASPRFGPAPAPNAVTPPLWHPAGIRYIVFSDDGSSITAKYDRKITIIRDLTARPTHRLRLNHRAGVHTAAFNPSGTRLLTASDDGTAAIWDSGTGERLAWCSHSAPVRMAVIAPDDATILTASMDDTACLWDAETGQRILPPMKHSDGVQRALFSPDGTRILTTSLDDTARLWDAATGRLLHRLQWKTQGGDFHEAGTLCAFSPDGSLIATASSDRTVFLWDARDGSCVAQFMYLHQAGINSISFSPNGKWLLTAGDDKIAHVFNFRATSYGKMVCSLSHAAPVLGARFAPDGASLVTISVDQTARIWDALSGTPRTLPMRHDARVNYAEFNGDGSLLITASDDRSARLWECCTGRPLLLPLKHPKAVLQASFHPRDSCVVTACGDGASYVFDIPPDERGEDELLLEAEILAAHRLDETSTLVPLSLEDWGERVGKTQPQQRAAFA